MATEADLIQKFKDLNIPVGADFEELIHTAFAGANLADLVNNYDSRITTVENDLSTAKNSIQANTDNKVTDNKNGTEQLNGIQVQPYNKLSDVTSVRNIVLQTDNAIPYIAKGGIGEAIQDFSLYDGFPSLPSGTQVYYSYDLVVKNADGGIHWFGWDSPWSAFVNNQSITTDGIHHFQGTTTIPDADITKGQFIHPTIDYSHATYQVKNLMVVVGSIPVTHLPAPEDKADDSKVAHLSGANNFDTIPTVNNNPLLLASSLPSDITRTTKDANFTGKLQKSGIDVATTTDVTTAVSTATANMVDPSKPTNFTAGLKSGGVDVATAADLKSIEDASWHTVTGKNDTFSDYILMYKINDAEKYVDFIFYGTMGITIHNDTNWHEIIDLSTIVKNPKDVSGGLIALIPAANGGGLTEVSKSGTKLVFNWQYNNTSLFAGNNVMSFGSDTKTPFMRVSFY